MQSIDFHGLPRSMQERFVACVAGRGDPTPILRSELRSRAALGWGALGVGSAVGLALYCRHGFGELHNASSLHYGAALLVYFTAIALITLSVVRSVELRIREAALPYRRGIYVFPVTLVDARDAILRVWPLAELSSFEPRGSSLHLELEGAQFAFDLGNGAEAELAAARLQAALSEARALGDVDHPRTTLMFTLDPLQRARMSSPLGSKASLSRRLPSWTRLAWIAAPAVGLLLALPVRSLRNRQSDERMFARANEIGDTESFRAYLASGERHRAEVSDVLLPRAELKEAAKVGTVAAIDRYRDTHPRSAITSEIDAARRTAMLADLEHSQQPGTVAALHEFGKRHPDHGLEPELRKAMHALFAPTLEEYRKRVNEPEARNFVERLFALSERRAREGSTAASTIAVRFRRAPSRTMKKADKMVSEHNWFIGEASYPSRYFDPAHLAKREDALYGALTKRLGEALGSRVFTFEHGALVDAEALPAVDVPTLFITHGVEWPGTFDGSISNPRGIWIGVSFPFQGTFVLPNDTKTLHFDLEVKEPLPMSVVEAHPKGGTPSDPLEEKVYQAMAQDAFGQLEAKCLAMLGATPNIR